MHQPEPSAWVARYASYVPAGSRVLDLACGGGRHTRLLAGLGFDVLAVDRNITALGDLAGHPSVEAIEVDLEDGRDFPFAPGSFGAVVVTNYLHRPILPAIVAAVDAGGVLIYETFARGNEAFGGLSRPDFLLNPGELLDAVRGELRVLAYEDLIVEEPRPAAVQRIAARRE